MTCPHLSVCLELCHSLRGDTMPIGSLPRAMKWTNHAISPWFIFIAAFKLWLILPSYMRKLNRVTDTERKALQLFFFLHSDMFRVYTRFRYLDRRCDKQAVARPGGPKCCLSKPMLCHYFETFSLNGVELCSSFHLWDGAHGNYKPQDTDLSSVKEDRSCSRLNRIWYIWLSIDKAKSLPLLLSEYMAWGALSRPSSYTVFQRTHDFAKGTTNTRSYILVSKKGCPEKYTQLLFFFWVGLATSVCIPH